MKVSVISTLLLAAGAIAGRSPQHVNKKLPERLRREPARGLPALSLDKRTTASEKKKKHIIPQTHNTTKFAVDGKKIPDVDFDIGESYAGLLPISSQKGAGELYFWFFPSEHPHATDEIVIWLNGGPGCSSLEGFLQENGPFLQQYGTYKPVQNNYRWNNLTNMIWVEQPAGTGFSSKGTTPAATSEEEVAAQFAGFWKNFIETFHLQHKKVYLTGESYAGLYVPYIASHFISQNNTALYDVHGIMIYDPATTYDVLMTEIPATPFVDYWAPLFGLNKTFMDDIHNRSEICGYNAFLEEALVYPPKGPLPTPPNADGSMIGCSLWEDILEAVSLVNPCFDIYQVATTCPLLYDVLGYPGSFGYLPDGAQVYFNRTDVQKAINAPIQPWEECTDGILTVDNSDYSAFSVLPGVIEHTNNVIIGQGMMDFIIIYNGTLAMVQNMTFNGAQGFSKGPNDWDEFFVPYHSELSQGNLAGSGVQGAYHTERGLTVVTVQLSGHMIPQYAPSSAYRMLEVLLNRTETLGTRSDFTTQTGDFGNHFNFVTANVTR